jgi:hypothetical protein
LAKGQLTVHFEFPAEGTSSISAKGFVQPMDDGLGGELEGLLRVPEQAKCGEVTVKVSVPEGKGVRGEPLRVETDTLAVEVQ